jgi:hypothetical protein
VESKDLFWWKPYNLLYKKKGAATLWENRLAQNGRFYLFRIPSIILLNLIAVYETLAYSFLQNSNFFPIYFCHFFLYHWNKKNLFLCLLLVSPYLKDMPPPSPHPPGCLSPPIPPLFSATRVARWLSSWLFWQNI